MVGSGVDEGVGKLVGYDDNIVISAFVRKILAKWEKLHQSEGLMVENLPQD